MDSTTNPSSPFHSTFPHTPLPPPRDYAMRQHQQQQQQQHRGEETHYRPIQPYNGNSGSGPSGPSSDQSYPHSSNQDRSGLFNSRPLVERKILHHQSQQVKSLSATSSSSSRPPSSHSLNSILNDKPQGGTGGSGSGNIMMDSHRPPLHRGSLQISPKSLPRSSGVSGADHLTRQFSDKSGSSSFSATPLITPPTDEETTSGSHTSHQLQLLSPPSSGESPARIKIEQEVDEELERGKKGQKKRTRLNAPQANLLRKVWVETCFPSTERRTWLAEQTGLSVRQVQVWFQNQRQKQRNEEYEASKSFSNDGPHPLSGSNAPFTTTPVALHNHPRDYAPRDGPLQSVWNPANGYHHPREERKSFGSGSESRPRTGESSRRNSNNIHAPDLPLGGRYPRMDSMDRPTSPEGSSHGSHVGHANIPAYDNPSRAIHLPGAAHSSRPLWEMKELVPAPRCELKRGRESPEDMVPRPVKMYRSAAELGQSLGPDDGRIPRLPSIREMGLGPDVRPVRPSYARLPGLASLGNVITRPEGDRR